MLAEQLTFIAKVPILEGLWKWSNALRKKTWLTSGTITLVKQRPFLRRKLSVTVVRKAITSYYTEQEQKEIAQAARRKGISLSSFVASASLTEARRTNLKP